MKKLFTLFTLFVLTITMMAQAPQKFTYQAIVRDASGKLMNSTQVGVRVSILKDNADGLSIYSESHQQTTNANGLLSLEIGGGNVINGDFTAIEWGSGSYFIKTEIDVAGGNNYSIVTTQQLLSVPYALYAGSAANQFSGDYNDLSNKPTIPTQVSAFNNDARYITRDSLPTKVSAFENDAKYITMDSMVTVPDKVSAFENDANYIVENQLLSLISDLQRQIDSLKQNKELVDTTKTSEMRVWHSIRVPSEEGLIIIEETDAPDLDLSSATVTFWELYENKCRIAIPYVELVEENGKWKVILRTYEYDENLYNVVLFAPKKKVSKVVVK